MNLGMVGLGRMGANMTERLREHGHTVETYARTNPERTANSLVELASKLPQPRVVWLMIPAGDADRERLPDAPRAARGWVT